MTGIRELTRIQVVPAAPERIRVSVLGEHTQLDIALPLDVPVSNFLPDVARLINSRKSTQVDESTGDERRTFWMLSRFEGGSMLAPEQTLREADVVNGELLRLSSERALSPPTLYDDVVDAAARLNKAAYAAWDAASARLMAFVGIHLAAVVLVYLLVGTAFPTDRVAKVGIAVAVVFALVGAAAIAWRSYRLSDVATALGWAAIPITAGILWATLARYGPYGLAAACGILLLLNIVYYRAIGVGHWGYLATSIPVLLGAPAFLAYAAGLRLDIVCLSAALVAALASLAVPRLTGRLGSFETPTVAVEVERDEWAFENPFVPPAASKSDRDSHSGVSMPTAEAVWNQVRAASLTRAALWTGLATTVAVAVIVVLHRQVSVGWPALAFAWAVAAVLGLRSRVPDTWFERAGAAVPGLALLMVSCVIAQDGKAPIALTAVGVLLAVAAGAALLGILEPGRGSDKLSTVLNYLEYVAVAALIPLAMWVVGIYDSLGHW